MVLQGLVELKYSQDRKIFFPDHENILLLNSVTPCIPNTAVNRVLTVIIKLQV